MIRNALLKSNYKNSLNLAYTIILCLKDYEYKKLAISSKSEIIIDVYFSNVKSILSLFSKFSLLNLNKLSDIVVYDRPVYKIRYIITYVLSNPLKDFKIRIRSTTSPEYSILQSIENIYFSSSWGEREALDMYGIKFIGNSDMRRILGDYGFWGFPGRKDFPLTGTHSYLYSINFLRVFKIRGTLKNIWNIFFQKNIYK